MLEDRALVELRTPPGTIFASSSQHSGDWLFALPVASCGLRLDDEVVRVAVGLRLGPDLCVIVFHTNVTVAPKLTSAFFAKAPGRSAKGITLLTW